MKQNKLQKEFNEDENTRIANATFRDMFLIFILFFIKIYLINVMFPCL